MQSLAGSCDGGACVLHSSQSGVHLARKTGPEVLGKEPCFEVAGLVPEAEGNRIVRGAESTASKRGGGGTRSEASSGRPATGVAA